MLKSYVHVQTFLSGLLNRDDRGATAVEYGLIALVIIGAVVLLGGNLKNVFNNVANSVGTVTSSSTG